MHIYVDVVPYMTSKEAALRVARRTRPLTNPARAILAVVRTASVHFYLAASPQVLILKFLTTKIAKF